MAQFFDYFTFDVLYKQPKGDFLLNNIREQLLIKQLLPPMNRKEEALEWDVVGEHIWLHTGPCP